MAEGDWCKSNDGLVEGFVRQNDDLNGFSVVTQYGESHPIDGNWRRFTSSHYQDLSLSMGLSPELERTDTRPSVTGFLFRFEGYQQGPEGWLPQAPASCRVGVLAESVLAAKRKLTDVFGFTVNRFLEDPTPIKLTRLTL